MTHFRFAADFATDAETYWSVFFDEPYNVALYQRIGVKERRMLERKEDEQTISWQVRIMPDRDLPSFVQKIVGGDLGYVEISTYRKGQNRIDTQVEPTLMREKTKINAVYTLTAHGAMVRRVFEGDIAISIPFIGRKVEEFIVADMGRAYETTARFTTEWLAKRPR
ncbi:MAG: DUF2505 domain-containing protein [Myxococcales bacterium]|nr:DUF2505 domain-containing protein [Myxococcales bacterium]